MKQSAVEWLVEELNNIKVWTKNDIILQKADILIEQAKEMEKKQIIEAGNTCALLQQIHIDKVNKMSLEELEKYAEEDVLTCGEQYYNETYNK
jgi:hypothetical protein